MPVQIPKLKRNAPQETTSVGRIDVKLADPTESMQLQARATEKLIATGTDAYLDYEFREANSIATAAEVVFHDHHENALEFAKSQKGDPTDVYKEYEEGTKKKRKQVEESLGDVPSFTRDAIKARLAWVERKFDDRRITAETKQRSIYDNENTDALDKRFQNDLMHDVVNLDLKDPNAFVQFETTLGRMELNRRDLGLKEGTYTIKKNAKNEDVHSASEMYTQKLNEVRSKGIQGAIQNLLSSGDTEGAVAMQERYGRWLGVEAKAKLTEITKKEVLEQKVTQEFDKLRDLDESEISDSLSQLDPEIAKKVSADLSSYSNNKKTFRENASKINFEAAGKAILTKQQNGKPFVDENTMMKDPIMKGLMNGITNPAQIEALKRMVAPPKESDPDTVMVFYEKLQNNELETMTYSDFIQASAGLNENHKTMFEREWKNATTQTEVEKRQMFSTMGTELVNQLQLVKLIKERTGRSGYSNKEKIKITQYYDELKTFINQSPPGMTIDKQMDYVKKFVTAKIKKELFTPPVSAKPIPTKKNAVVTTNSKTSIMAPEQRETKKKMLADFYRANKRFPTPEETNKLMKEDN